MEICPHCLAETTSVSQLNCNFCSALLVAPMDAPISAAARRKLEKAAAKQAAAEQAAAERAQAEFDG